MSFAARQAAGPVWPRTGGCGGRRTEVGMGASTCSTMLMVPELTLEVKTVLSFGER